MAHQSIRLAHLLAFVALAGLATGDVSAQRGGGRGGGQARASTGAHQRGGRTQHASSGHRGAGAQHVNASGTRRGAATQHATSRSGTHRTATANNVNRGNGNRVNNGNINTGDVNVNVNGGYGHGYGYHPVARGVVAGATTAAIMGHYYSTLPSGCALVNQGGIVYHQCGSTWYRTDGNQYVVVQHP